MYTLQFRWVKLDNIWTDWFKELTEEAVLARYSRVYETYKKDIDGGHMATRVVYTYSGEKIYNLVEVKPAVPTFPLQGA